jgi:DNA-binding MarR family transcriptional regulator
LLRAQARVVELHKTRLAASLDLSLGEFDMIAELGNTEGLRMGELARKMITSPANVTRLATRLEKRGLVQRRRAEHSDREVVAQLTPKGEAFFADHFREVVTFTRDVMESALDREQLTTLAELCDQLSGATAPDS